MSTHYETISLDDDLVADHDDNFWEGDYSYGEPLGIWRCVDGLPVALIGVDGGEPEDQTLRRDWRWVVKALNDAYKLGRAEASR